MASPRDDFSKLLERPSCRRMGGDIEVSNLARSDFHNHKHVENSEASCNNDEEITG